MKRLFPVSILLLCLVSLAGCSLFVKDYYRATLVDDGQSAKKMAVNNPIKLQDLTLGVDAGTSANQKEIKDLVYILQKTRVFAKVDLLNQFETEPDLRLLFPRRESEKVGAMDLVVGVFAATHAVASVTPEMIGEIAQAVGQAGLSELTWGILPGPSVSNEFEFPLNWKSNDRSMVMTPRIKKYSRWGGWPFMTPLVLLGQWQMDEKDAMAKAVRTFLLKHESEIVALARKQ